MDLFTYLLAKNDKFSLAHKNDLFAYLLGKNNSIPLKTADGVSITIEALKTKINELKMTKESSQDGTPTPDNPIPVEVVEGYIKDGNNYVDVTVRRKNLFKSELEIGAINSANGTNAPSTNRIRTKDYISISDVVHTLSWLPNNCVMYGYCYDSSKNFLGITTGWNNTPFTFTPITNTSFIRFVWKKPNDSAIAIDDISNIQLEKGPVATSYEPYQESIVPIPLNENFIGGIGDYKDTLMVDKFGKCYLNKKITKIDSYNGETITTEYMSTTGGLDIGATIYYVTPSQLIDLNYTVDLKLFKGENNISNSEDMMMTLKYY